MSLNIAGLVISNSFIQDISRLSNDLGIQFNVEKEITFEEASSNWTPEGVFNVFFTNKATLVFYSNSWAQKPIFSSTYNSLNFSYSETSMAFQMDFKNIKNGIRSILEYNGERQLQEGEPIELESKHDSLDALIFALINQILGEDFNTINLEAKAFKCILSKQIGESISKTKSNNLKPASHSTNVRKWWMFWPKNRKQDQTEIQNDFIPIEDKNKFDSSNAMKKSNPYVDANTHPLSGFRQKLSNEFFNLKGNISKISIHEFRANKDSSKGEYREGKSYFFNKKHKIEREWWHKENKRVAAKFFYRDYQNGTKDKELFFNKENENHIGEWYFYDDYDLLIKEENLRDGIKKTIDYKVIHESDGIYHHGKYSIDKYVNGELRERNLGNGMTKQVFNYYKNGAIMSYEYFEKGALTSKKEFSESGEIVLSLNNDYEEGVLVESREEIIVYNIHGVKVKMQETKTTLNGKETNTTNYLYKNDLLVSVIWGLAAVCGYKYNDNGDLVESFFAGATDTFEYLDYDTHGNWIRRIEYLKNKPFRYVERDIEYFGSDS